MAPARSIRLPGAGRFRSRRSRAAPRSRSPSTASRTLVRALDATAKMLGAAALETHCADARVFLARETRLFDVVFLDPPFADAQWETLLPAAAARVAADGALYVEAAAHVAAPAGFAIVRGDKAGQVHYHLLRRLPGGDSGGAGQPSGEIGAC